MGKISCDCFFYGKERRAGAIDGRGNDHVAAFFFTQ